MASDQPPVFAQRLRRYRQAAGLTQEELADRAGLSGRGVQDLELGVRRVPHLDTVLRLVEALGLADADKEHLLAARRAQPAVLGTEVAPRAVAKAQLPDGLPLPLTKFVGRDNELAELKGLLASTRLLTLTGVGGVGKTRIALELAGSSAKENGAAVALIELAALDDPGLVIRAVASVLGIEDRAGRTLVQTVVDALRPRQQLLVLDTCEHLIQACAEVVESILRACPDVTILCTSREPLGIVGEVNWRVAPLTVPGPNRLPALGELGESDAVRLFVSRAGESRPGFGLTLANAAAIAQVCQRLDGIPLAVELAAAQLSGLSVEQIAERLDDRLRLLTSGGRTAQVRQRTLRGTLDWSYALLSESEQTVLARLSVFVGGWSLEAAEAVCANDRVGSQSVLELLLSLVNKSLVVAGQHGPATRYSLLDTVRAYALEKLQANPVLDVDARQSHRDWFVNLAERFDTEWRGPRQRAWLAELKREHGNLRAALRGCVDRAEATEGLRLSAALAKFWEVNGHLSEGRAWFEELLGLPQVDVPHPVRAKALYTAGYCVGFQGEFRRDMAAAEAWLGQSLTIWRALDDGHGVASALILIGIVAQQRGDDGQAPRLLSEALITARQVGDRINRYWALNQLAIAAVRQGDYARALALQEESLALKRQQGDAYGIGFSLLSLAELARLQGDFERATALVRENLALQLDLGYGRGVTSCLDLLAELTSQTEPESAARLLGAADILWEAHGGRRIVGTPEGAAQARIEVCVAALRGRLGSTAFESAWAEGSKMALLDVAVYALRTGSPNHSEYRSGLATAYDPALLH